MKMNTPWVESPFFEKIIKEKKLSSENEQIARDYHKNGFVVIKNQFSEEELDAVIQEMHTKGFNVDFNYENHRDANRCQDLWTYSDSVKNLSIKPSVLETLEMLYGREVVPFQTLNFLRGTQQKAHSDTIHFSSLPARYMAGVWIALEDITEENGPLFYYPGSHRMPEYNFNDFKEDLLDNSYDNYPEYENFIGELMDHSPYEKQVFLAKKGDILIWSSNIIHGGSPVLKEGTTRLSQVTHYFFKDCLYYSPMGSNTISGELLMRVTLKNIRTGQLEKMNYNGYRPRLTRTFKHLYVINEHLFYPKFLRFFTDIIYILKKQGIGKLMHLALNKFK
ncbi:phytanoyl-CoA dioxygenase family protein [Aquirufa sp. ROCK2-A2]